MKSLAANSYLAARLVCLGALLALNGYAQLPGKSSEPIPVSELGAQATEQYHGEGLSVKRTQDGARLRCVFQKLEGEVTRGGLWLTSTVEPSLGEKFRLTASAIGRGTELIRLSTNGNVTFDEKLVRCARPNLTEEYSVSVDGVRQDFLIAARPAGAGELRVELSLTGARAEAAAYGAKLILNGSKRVLAYNRVHVMDAAGKELVARLEVISADQLVVQVADTNASYPVRIDPCFCDANWTSLSDFPGANNAVSAIVVDDSGNVYFGGAFSLIGTVGANGIAKWNGSTWSALGSGVNGSVFAIAVTGSDVYVGGLFTVAGGTNNECGGATFGGGTNANNIAKWDGSIWSPLGAGMNAPVNALALNGTDLYAGGSFSFATNFNRVARWNFATGTWSPLGSGVSSTVSALAINGTDLYVGGSFTVATNPGLATVTVNRIARWNFGGNTWSALGIGVNNTVSALAVNGTDLYVGGDFITATNSGPAAVTVNRIARWNFTAPSWSSLGLGVSSTVSALAASGTDLYVGGAFTRATNSGSVTVVANRTARWNFTGNTWSTLGLGMNNSVSALAVGGGNLYAGGVFTTVTNTGPVSVTARCLATWNGTWSATAVGSGMDNTVYALLVNGTDLYAGGDFTTASGVLANRVAKWNGTSWFALGSGISGAGAPSVRSLAMIGPNLYVGGSFSTAGGVPVTSIAKWNTNSSSWSALGSGTDYGFVLSMAVSGTDLYIGGSIGWVTNPGPTTVTVNNIAKWDTLSGTWSALAGGLTNNSPGSFVAALAVEGTNLYAGGKFSRAGSVVATNIAKWNLTTSNWFALGAGVSGPVYALAASGTDLYAGGTFTKAGTTTANSVAKWNGGTWSAMDFGFNSDVYSLVVNSNGLYAGGSFTAAGTVATNASGTFPPAMLRIAKWDGIRWSPLDSGMDGFVYALATDASSNLFAGGTFTRPGGGDFVHPGGGPVSPFIAEALTCAETVIGPEIVVEQPAGSDLPDSGSLNFGNVEVGDAKPLDFTIRNLGNAPLNISGIHNDTTNTAGVFLFTNISTTLAPGDSTNFTVTFTPTNPLSLGIRSAFIMITNNDANENPFYFTLNATAIAPAAEIVVEQPAGNNLVDGVASVNFGSVSIGSTTNLVFTIRNIGHADLTNLHYSMVGIGAFLVTGFPVAPVSGPSGSTTFTVSFTPPSVGAWTNTLSITNSDANENPFDITLIGTGPLPTISPIPDQTVVAKSSTTSTLTVAFRVTGIGTITPSASQVPPPAVVLPPPNPTFQITTQAAVFSGSGPDRTVSLGYNVPFFTPFMSSAYGLFPTHAQVTLSIVDAAGVPVSRTFSVYLTDALDEDGISDVVENGAPNGGDGNSDGILDSEQLEVASLLTAAVPPSYVTLAVTNGLRLVDVQALTPPVPVPAGASFPQGLIQFRVEGLPVVGASVTVTQIFQSPLPAGLTYYKYGNETAGAAGPTYYPFMYNPPSSPTGAEIVPAQNQIILHLKDGALGDDDWIENGSITDPSGPALVSVEQFSLNISLLTPTTAQIAWPAAAGARTLQYTDNLVPPITWQPDSHPLITNGLLKSVTVDLTNAARFYSLGAP